MMRTALTTTIAAAILSVLTVVLVGGRGHAYCAGDGDTCPTAGASLETFHICGNASTISCTGTYGVTNADTIQFVRIVVGGSYRLAVCISGSSIHRLRHSSYRGGGMLNWGSQQTDMAFCSGAGNDVLTVTEIIGTCGGTSTTPWDYGAGSYWLELRGQSGQDSIRGGTGHDRICGGSGSDWGGSGTPNWRQLNGWSLSDDIDGWTGNDYCEGYTGDGDEVWGYDAGDYVMDATGSGGFLFGEGAGDICVWAAQFAGEVNCAGPSCDSGSCTCGTANDDSCLDQTGNALSQTVGCEIFTNCSLN